MNPLTRLQILSEIHRVILKPKASTTLEFPTEEQAKEVMEELRKRATRMYEHRF